MVKNILLGGKGRQAMFLTNKTGEAIVEQCNSEDIRFHLSHSLEFGNRHMFLESFKNVNYRVTQVRIAERI
jgi:hypothetical protein